MKSSKEKICTIWDENKPDNGGFDRTLYLKVSRVIGNLIALVLAFAMIFAVMTANAASITINRDSSFDTAGQDGDGNVYKYYKVFSAAYNPNNTSTGGGSTDGAPGSITESNDKAAYTATATVAAKLGEWVAATETTDAHWEKAEGNLWFDLSPIAGSNPQTYNVAWANASEDAATVQAAAAWLIANQAYEAGPTALTFDETAKAWKTAANIDAGYYLVEGATGKNLVAATTDVTINEKNTYPPQDKTQSDEDDTTKNDETRDVAIGDVLNYDVTVTIPATAKVGDKILVYDKNSEGLTYNSDSMTVTNTAGATVGETDYSGEGAVTGAAWQRLITVDEDTVLGSTVVFSFTMTVNASALVDTGKANESALKYGPGSGETPWPFEGKPDKVEYKTYFAGIHKIDGSTSEDLAGVEFELKEAGTAFTVIKDGDYYIPSTATGASSTVVTDSQGRIMIRGLDEDKAYTLTETKTLDGYNMLTADVTLTLYEDTYTAAVIGEDGTTVVTESTTSFDPSKTNPKWGEVENNKGSVLPSTGGIGTTIYYILGSLLVLGAGIILVTKRRMSVSK